MVAQVAKRPKDENTGLDCLQMSSWLLRLTVVLSREVLNLRNLL